MADHRLGARESELGTQGGNADGGVDFSESERASAGVYCAHMLSFTGRGLRPRGRVSKVAGDHPRPLSWRRSCLSKLRALKNGAADVTSESSAESIGPTV
jgi:hypothetical protein